MQNIVCRYILIMDCYCLITKYIFFKNAFLTPIFLICASLLLNFFGAIWAPFPPFFWPEKWRPSLSSSCYDDHNRRHHRHHRDHFWSWLLITLLADLQQLDHSQKSQVFCFNVSSEIIIVIILVLTCFLMYHHHHKTHLFHLCINMITAIKSSSSPLSISSFHHQELTIARSI